MNSWNFHNTGLLLKQLLVESKNHHAACILLSNNFEDRNGKYNVVAGFGEKRKYNSPADLEITPALKLGFIAYDLKNNFEKLESLNPASIEVPDFYFFEPEQLLEIYRDGTIEKIDFNLQAPNIDDFEMHFTSNSNWKCKTDKDSYLSNINSIRSQIIDGDFYEINYCIEWSAEASDAINPYELFYKLNAVSPAPFSAFFKFGSTFILCSSPERFLKKNKSKLISQPIKGTRKRGESKLLDAAIVKELETAEKDRAENIMITDLVRNDLSKICKFGTVKVEELCKIYSFSHVHQMISLVTGEVDGEQHFSKILEATFPMGSMTGAPKIKVMQEIEKYENFKRGLYSGSIGWYQNGDFDLNVVIRTLQYDELKNKLIYNVGGAIVYDSIGENEFEECETKAAGIMAAMKKRD